MAAITVPRRQLFVGGQWTEPVRRKTLPVVNPATEDIIGSFFFSIEILFEELSCFAHFLKLDQSILRVSIQSTEMRKYAFHDLLYP